MTTRVAEMLERALDGGYAVPAINVVNDLTMEAVLRAADEARSPLIVQTSVKTVRSIGSDVLMAMWRAMSARVSVPVALHLDHCPDRSVLTECLRAGWDGVLFDASALPVADNLRQTIEVVAEAAAHGAAVEGEIESITGVEDGVGTDEVSRLEPLDVVLDFIERTGVDVFAPSVGNAHGRYREAPRLDVERVREIRSASGIPQALHGGSGMQPAQYAAMIAAGCAKVNISTALKESFMRATAAHLERAAADDRWDPPSMFADVGDAVAAMTLEHIRLFGSGGRA